MNEELTFIFISERKRVKRKKEKGVNFKTMTVGRTHGDTHRYSDQNRIEKGKKIKSS